MSSSKHFIYLHLKRELRAWVACAWAFVAAVMLVAALATLSGSAEAKSFDSDDPVRRWRCPTGFGADEESEAFAEPASRRVVYFGCAGD